jgi:hypothetical protein
MKIEEEVKVEQKIKEIEKDFLKKEISIRFEKIIFLKNIYDTEANKIDKSYIVIDKLDNYDYYNKLFF